MDSFQVHVKQTIADILHKRSRFSEAVNLQATRVSELTNIFRDLLDLLPLFARDLPDGDFLQLQGTFDRLRTNITNEQNEFAKLYRRFNRKTINIGVIGRARQGKSTLLKSLSGLTDSVIPSREGEICTSVQSTIYHYDQSRTYAKVYFHTTDTFLHDVIGTYLTELGRPLPSTIETFMNKPLFDFDPGIYPTRARSEMTWNHLRECHDHWAAYRQFIKAEPHVMEAEENDIATFVSRQRDTSDYRYFAVRKVEIFCHFPSAKTAVNDIGWIDMPGLGDTRPGDEGRMIKALGEDTDFILLVRRPSTADDLMDIDTDLSDAAHKALKDRLPLNRWSFMVLNYDGRNLDMCNYFKDHKLRHSLNVADFIIVNCMVADGADDKQRVLTVNELLERVLKYLIDNIEALDASYASSFKASFEKLQKEIYGELNIARSVFHKHASVHSQYVDFFDTLMRKLANRLEELRAELLLAPAEPDPHFRQEIKSAIDKCRGELDVYRKDADHAFILEIQGSWNDRPSLGGTYDKCMHELRSGSLRHFHGLECGLRLSLNEKKEKVSEIFDTLGLYSLSDTPAVNRVDFIEKLTAHIPKDLENLSRGFGFLASFELQYKGFIQNIVWEHMRRFLPPSGDPSAVAAMVYGQAIQKLLSGLPSGVPLETLANKLSNQDKEVLDKLPDGINVDKVIDVLSDLGAKGILQSLPVNIKSAAAIGYLAVQILGRRAGSAFREVVESKTNSFDAEAVKFTLLARYEQAIDQCEVALEKLIPAPAEIGISMIEEFIITSADYRRK